MNLPVIIEILKWISCFFGGLLLYASIFLIRERNVVQSRLENWWSQINQMESASLSKNSTFLIVISGKMKKIQDAVYGEKLFSVRCFGVSTSLSIAFPSLFCFILSVLKLKYSNIIFFFCVSVFFLALPLLNHWLNKYAKGVHPVLKNLLNYLPFFVIVAGWIVLVFINFMQCGFSDRFFYEASGVTVPFVSSYFADIFAIILARKGFDAAIVLKDFYLLILLVMLNVAVIFIFCVVPIVLCTTHIVTDYRFSTGVFLFGISNMSTVTPSALYLVSIILMLIYKPILFHIERFIYFLKVTQVIQNHFVMAMLGVALIAPKFPDFAARVESILTKYH